MPGTKFTIEVQPIIPERFNRLPELANDLFYTWNERVNRVFEQLDPDLWVECRHNPKLFLRRVAQSRLDDAVNDRLFVEAYQRALTVFDTYRSETGKTPAHKHISKKTDLIAYFCAEFGFHESLPIYSGGLGILAGDHCKAASDLNIPFVAIGLLYRQGYFTQTIDAHGNQVAHFTPTDFEHLPIEPARDANGAEIRVTVPIKDKSVYVKVWRTNAGHIKLYLLDTDISENSDQNRSITYQLYGGDQNTRIQQEIVLSIGGVRALRALGLSPTVWHINEGHAAFMMLERCREYITQGLSFAAALELSAAATVFTTHTPVPAGHDVFQHKQVEEYLGQFVRELNVSLAEILKLGDSQEAPGRFNMTALALRGSRFHNGVSRIHGSVAARMCQEIWPQVPPEENPMGYVTNGVHIPTFLAREWSVLFDMRFGNAWRNELLNEEYWKCLDDIPAHNFWNVRLTLKAEMLHDVCDRARKQYHRNQCSELTIQRLTRGLSQDLTNTLVLGFARRFATYKRATLIFSDPERLARLLNDPKKPVIIIFAGKAHPSDMPGQHLIKVIHDFSRSPQFEGKIVLLEDYDLSLGRSLVAGVDVWLNTPEYPLEASGTSGEKAGMNGVLNLSVLDGWWDEGFNGSNGWGITPHGPQYDNTYRNREEARQMLDILEHQVIPVYFKRNIHGFSDKWIEMSKASMKKLIPCFSAERMLMDYVKKYYGPAAKQAKRFAENNYAPATLLADWKAKVRRLWPATSIKHVTPLPRSSQSGQIVKLAVSVALNGLDPTDVMVECLFGREDEHGEFKVISCNKLLPNGLNEYSETRFELELTPPMSGLQTYKVRMYPHHTLMAHSLETGCMIWL